MQNRIEECQENSSLCYWRILFCVIQIKQNTCVLSEYLAECKFTIINRHGIWILLICQSLKKLVILLVALESTLLIC